jgi:hypothetical protein
LKNVTTFEVFLFHVIDGVKFLFPEAEGLGHHTATDVGHRIEVNLDTEGVNEVSEACGVFRSHEFAFFEQVHFFVYFFNKKFELSLVAFLLFVELNESFFEGNNQCLNQIIILCLLSTSCKSAIDTHEGLGC